MARIDAYIGPPPTGGETDIPDLWVNNLTGDDDRDIATAANEATPVATINRAMALATDAGGGHLIAVVPTGTDYDPIWITSPHMPEEVVEVRGWGGEVMVSDPDTIHGDMWINHDFMNWQFTRLVFNHAGIDWNNTGPTGNVKFSFCRNTRESMIFQMQNQGTGYLIFEDCDITSDVTNTSSNESGRGIKVGSGTDVDLQVRRCTFHSIQGEDALQLGNGGSTEGGILIEDCDFDNVESLPEHEALGFHTDCIQIIGGFNVRIRRNRFRNSESCIIMVDGEVTGLVVENNVIEDAGQTTQFYYCPGAIIRNNTFMRGIRIGSDSTHNPGYPQYTVAQVTNNITSNTIDVSGAEGAPTPIVTNQSNNLLTSTVTFVGSGDDPFELASGSDGVNEGTNSFAASEDILERTRPVGGTVDVGAYERQS